MSAILHALFTPITIETPFDNREVKPAPAQATAMNSPAPPDAPTASEHLDLLVSEPPCYGSFGRFNRKAVVTHTASPACPSPLTFAPAGNKVSLDAVALAQKIAGLQAASPALTVYVQALIVFMTRVAEHAGQPLDHQWLEREEIRADLYEETTLTTRIHKFVVANCDHRQVLAALTQRLPQGCRIRVTCENETDLRVMLHAIDVTTTNSRLRTALHSARLSMLEPLYRIATLNVPAVRRSGGWRTNVPAWQLRGSDPSYAGEFEGHQAALLALMFGGAESR